MATEVCRLEEWNDGWYLLVPEDPGIMGAYGPFNTLAAARARCAEMAPGAAEFVCPRNDALDVAGVLRAFLERVPANEWSIGVYDRGTQRLVYARSRELLRHEANGWTDTIPVRLIWYEPPDADALVATCAVHAVIRTIDVAGRISATQERFSSTATALHEALAAALAWIVERSD